MCLVKFSNINKKLQSHRIANEKSIFPNTVFRYSFSLLLLDFIPSQVFLPEKHIISAGIHVWSIGQRQYRRCWQVSGSSRAENAGLAISVPIFQLYDDGHCFWYNSPNSGKLLMIAKRVRQKRSLSNPRVHLIIGLLKVVLFHFSINLQR